MARTVTIEGVGTGWKPELPMARDYHFADRSRASMLTAEQLPRNTNNRQYDAPVRNQGNEGSCVGHGWAAAADFLTRRDGDRFTAVYSPRFAYNAARMVEQGRDKDGALSRDGGAFVRDGGLALRNMGVCPESVWKYRPNGEDFKKEPTPNRIKQAHRFRVEIQRCDDVDSILSAIAAGHPVVFGTTCFTSWWTREIDASGVFGMPTSGASEDGGHCMKGTDYDLDFDFGQGIVGAIISKNSWSDTWANQSRYKPGYSILPLEFFRRNWADDAWAAVKEAA